VKRSTRPRKATTLSKSLHQRLNSYAIAASAAGVGVLALAQPAETEIIYTGAHDSLACGAEPILLDLAHDGTREFKMSQYYMGPTCSLRASALGASSGIVGSHYTGRKYDAFAVRPGQRIGHKLKFPTARGYQLMAPTSVARQATGKSVQAGGRGRM
jgi:hypothetical protein